MFQENASEFTRDFGVPCICGAYPFRANFNSPDDVLGQAGVNMLSTEWMLEIATADVLAGSIASGVQIAVDATSMGLGALTFKVRDVLSVDDGFFKNVTLTQLPPLS